MEKYIERLQENKDLNGILIEIDSIQNAINEILMIIDYKMTTGNRINLRMQLDELEEELKEAKEARAVIVDYHNKINNLLLKY